MELSNLSSSIVRVGSKTIPAIGFGTYLLKGDTGLKAMKHAIKVGYRHIDTAHLYDNEELVGQAVQESILEGVLKSRDEIFITSKLGTIWHDPKKIPKVIQYQVNRLGLDYIDLYLIHCPWGHQALSDEEESNFGGRPAYKDDCPIPNSFDHREMWKALEDAVDAGLVKEIGLSNFDNSQVQYILDECRIKPFNNQVEIHPWIDQSELVEFHKRNDISVTSFMSLGRAGRSAAHGGNLFENELLEKIAKNYNVTIAQLLLKYQLQRGIIIVPKSKTPERIEENAKLFHFEISSEDMDQIKAMNKDCRSCNFLANGNNPNFPPSWKKEQFFLDSLES